MPWINWIPVNDHLPEDELPAKSNRKQIKCLVTTEHRLPNGKIRRYVISCSRECYQPNYWFWSKNITNRNVTAWAPMPRAYPEE